MKKKNKSETVSSMDIKNIYDAGLVSSMHGHSVAPDHRTSQDCISGKPGFFQGVFFFSNRVGCSLNRGDPIHLQIFIDG